LHHLQGLELIYEQSLSLFPGSIGSYHSVQIHRGDIRQRPANLKRAEKMFKEMGMEYWLALIRRSGVDVERFKGEHPTG
jgi:hypothetical protein